MTSLKYLDQALDLQKISHFFVTAEVTFVTVLSYYNGTTLC